MSAPTSSTVPSHSASASRRRSVLLFLSLFLLLVASHLPLLKLPYYWDEAGYFVPAALDLMRHGWWVPRTTLPNGHPPLLMAWLAAVWKLFGFSPLVTRVSMLLWAAATLWGLYRLGEQVTGARTSRWAVLLFAVTPLFFAQASLAQLDLPATMFVLWALVFRLRGGRWAYALAAAGACLAKDTALVAFFALALYDFVLLMRERAAAGTWIHRLSPHLVPAIALAAWYACYHSVTGYWVGNPQYLAYNVGDAAFSLPRILMSLARRLWQLLGYNGTWLLTLLGLASWLRRKQQPVAPLPHRAGLLTVIAGYLVFHSILGGAVLARYLLPALALYILLLTPSLLRLGDSVVHATSRRVAARSALVLGCAVFLMANWLWNPPYPFPYEDNLAYAVFIHLHQEAAGYLEQHPPQGAVLTAWPATGELNDPDLGYVHRPLAVTAVDDFTPRALVPVERARPNVGAALVYSREYRPQLDVANTLPFWEHWADRYFHHQAPQTDTVLLQRLGLHRVYYRRLLGQWVEVAEPAGGAAKLRRAEGREKTVESRE